jgi:hypothetical protein
MVYRFAPESRTNRTLSISVIPRQPTAVSVSSRPRHWNRTLLPPFPRAKLLSAILPGTLSEQLLSAPNQGLSGLTPIRRRSQNRPFK